ncbi:MAG: type II toxin-antitoxin system RelE/ParE family toxin [Longimicrobiales bacterium]|nr:type II toxin-antitoxin system RelE/ParE family toxin [Longimicrobiales bacterium]
MAEGTPTSGFRFTPVAVRDLEAIWDHIASDRPETASTVVRRIIEAVERLSEFPLMGHPRDDLADESLRVWPILGYLIIYRPDRQPIEVLRVLSGYRDLVALFPGDRADR